MILQVILTPFLKKTSNFLIFPDIPWTHPVQDSSFVSIDMNTSLLRTITQSSTPYKTANIEGSESETDLFIGCPSMTSTPYDKIHKSFGSSISIESVNYQGFLPAKMDSGYFESFSGKFILIPLLARAFCTWYCR